MSVLASKFDVTRGYPHGALEEDFDVKKSGSTYESIPGGHLVVAEADASGVPVVSAGTTPNTSTADLAQVWLVVEGNDDFSGSYVKKVHCCKVGSGLTWETDQYAAGTYVVGTPLTFDSGKLKVKGTNDQLIGHVVQNEVTARGVLRVSDV